MSRSVQDLALDALLDEYRPPSPPADLAARVADAAMVHKRIAGSQPAAPPAPARRDRRGAWLRRPIVVGGTALGLAFTGAMAATLAGVRIDLSVLDRVVAAIPFLDRSRDDPSAAPASLAPPAPSASMIPQDPTPEPAPNAAPSVARPATAPAAPARSDPTVLERRSEPALPAPRDDRLERSIERSRTRLQAEVPGVHDAGVGQAVRDPDALAGEPRSDSPARHESALADEPVRDPEQSREASAAAPADAAVELERLRRLRVERLERLRAAREARQERLQRLRERRERFERVQRTRRQ